MKRTASSSLMRLVLASALLFVLAGLAPASAFAQGNPSNADFNNYRGLVGAAFNQPAPVSNTVYIVKPFDTLARIAARFGVSLGAILKANPSIRNPNLIYIGQRIVIPTGSSNTGGKTFSQVNIYLIGLDSGNVGCGDQVVAVKRNIAPTRAPLTAALQQLLSLHSQFYGQSGLYNALYQSNLSLQSITSKGTVWNVYLRGKLQLGGVCDIPRVQAQLTQTALQFSTVKQVHFFVNGVALEKALSQK